MKFSIKFSIPVLVAITIVYTISLAMLNSAAGTQAKIPETRVTATPAEILIPQVSVQVPILMYHYIREVDPAKDFLGADLSVTPEKFNEQLIFLREKGYTTITLDDIMQAWEQGTPLPAKPVILTFDDGYDDFFTNAFPLLQKHSAKATTYVVSNFFDQPHYLTTSQLLELAASPLITIASHTQNHADLRVLKMSKLQEELNNSKVALEKFISKPVRHFAYPYGRFTNGIAQEVEKAGYKTATTTLFGYDHTPKNRFTMKRVRVAGATSLTKFEKLLEPDTY